MAQQRLYLEDFRRPADVLTLEVLRSLDDLFMADLMEPSRAKPPNQSEHRSIASWGVNHALSRVLPLDLEARPFRYLASSPATQDRADDFLLDCGVLHLAERYEVWLRQGILTGALRSLPADAGPGPREVLVLKSAADSHYDEDVGRAGIRWASSLAMARRAGHEARLNARTRKLTREMEGCIGVYEGWGLEFYSTPDIDAFFGEWARLYLERIYAQDLLGPEDMLGGRPFSRYLEVLTELSARSQKQIAFAALLKRRRPDLHLRNLLTAWSPRDALATYVARRLDADRLEIEEILNCLTLSPENAPAHLAAEGTVWAPLVRTGQNAVVLPVYGLDINPFLFLLADLRSRHQRDWSRVANNREQRWIDELKPLFAPPRWSVRDRPLRLREGKLDKTDIDFAAYDAKTSELALFQLKWQQPVDVDDRARRSAGRNLLDESNTWIEEVSAWIDRHGLDELVARLGFKPLQTPDTKLIVLGRYHAHYTGFDLRDTRAHWSDWAHFRKARLEGPRRSVGATLDALGKDLARSRAGKRVESRMLPVGDLGVVLNPLAEPP